MLSFTEDDLAQLNREFALWSPVTIAAGTYPGQDAATASVGHPNFLAVHQDVPEDHVHRITQAIFENLDFLATIHDATKEIAIDTALRGLTVPLHPGAARYLSERGVTIDDSLMPPQP